MRGTHSISSSPVDDIGVRIRPEAVTRLEAGYGLTQGGGDHDREGGRLGGRGQVVSVSRGALVTGLVSLTS